MFEVGKKYLHKKNRGLIAPAQYFLSLYVYCLVNFLVSTALPFALYNFTK